MKKEALRAAARKFGAEGIPISAEVSVRVVGNVFKDEERAKRRAAVLVPLVRLGEAQEWSILYTLRTQTVATHKGQVSLPGGHIELGETAEDAAVREAREELGSGLGNVSIVSHMQQIPALTGTLVTPVLGMVETPLSLSALSPCTDEVERVFSRSVQELVSTRKVERKEHRGFVYHMPYFGEGEERIWGLTGWITDGVLNFLRPNLRS